MNHKPKPTESYEILSDTDATWARVDLDRERRTGLPEVILAEGKQDRQVVRLAELQLHRQGKALATRVAADLGAELVATIPSSRYHSQARVWSCKREGDNTTRGSAHIRTNQAEGEKPLAMPRVAILTAGTSDIPVAEEARCCAEWFGLATSTHYDVGVAGLQRLQDQVASLRISAAVIAVAGMDGALPTVLAGLIPSPVIAVPTSVGYGASYQGIAPLLTMLSGCAPGVGVVNIDNGFGGAALAAKILRIGQ